MASTADQWHAHHGVTVMANTAGQVISVGDARFKCPELLFDPSLRKHLRRHLQKDEGIHECVYSSIMKCDGDITGYDIRLDLFSNIVICGSSTMFKGQ